MAAPRAASAGGNDIAVTLCRFDRRGAEAAAQHGRLHEKVEQPHRLVVGDLHLRLLRGDVGKLQPGRRVHGSNVLLPVLRPILPHPGPAGITCLSRSCMNRTLDELDTPCVVIDAARVEANLQRAQAHAGANGYALRPHIKTHKLPRLALRQLALGAVGITVQKLGEAEVMADAGVNDIFLPYNIIGQSKLRRLRALNERVTLAVTADSPDTLAGHASALET